MYDPDNLGLRAQERPRAFPRRHPCLVALAVMAAAAAALFGLGFVAGYLAS